MTERTSVDCSVVIVNYNTEALLAECLASLEADAGPEAAVEVIVVDNSATLRASGLHKRFPWVYLVENRENVGFARASNQGLHLARGRNLLLLNPDTRLRPGAIDALIRHLDAHPEAGVVAPRLLNADGSLQYSCRRFPGLLTVFFGRYSLLTRFLPQNPVSRDYLYLDWDHAAVREVDWVSGACLMVRREVMEHVGPLDEGYFLFVEDMDWCRRIWDAGWRVVYAPQAIVTHLIGASRGPVSPRVVLARHHSMLRYATKHLRLPWPLAALVRAGLTLRAGALVLTNTLAGGAQSAVAGLARLAGLVRVERREAKIVREPGSVPE
jgi:hypothetical protein